MAFPDGWGRRCALVIDADQVSASLSNFPVLFTEDNLPSEMFDADGSYPALDGGGDIRFSSDSAGTTQIPCEVVDFTIDNDPANGTAQIWVLVGSVSSATDTTIYVWYNKSGESQPAEDATYGAQAVWGDYDFVVHMDGGFGAFYAYDSGPNQKDFTLANIDGSNDYAGKIGRACDMDGVSDYMHHSQTSNPPTSFTVSAWVDLDARDSYGAEVFSHNNSVGLRADQTSGSVGVNGFAYTGSTWRVTGSGTFIAGDGWKYLTYAFDDTANSQKVYINDTEKGSTSYTESPAKHGDNLYIGRHPGNGNYHWNGRIDEIRLCNEARSEDWIDAEYVNQSAPGTFATPGTPETPGTGGTGITFLADVAGASVTAPIDAQIARALTAAIDGDSATAAAVTAALARALAAEIAGTSTTPAAAAALARAIVATIAGASATATIDAQLARTLAAAITCTSSTADAAATIVRALAAAIEGASTASAVAYALARDLLTAIAGQSATSQIAASLEGVIALVASIAGASATSTADAATLRLLAASIAASSTTPDAAAALVRDLVANIAGASVTSDVTAVLTSLVQFAAGIQGVSIASSVAANIARSLAAAVAGASSTADLQAAIARALLADIAGTSLTPDDLVLILAGLGVIVDPDSESLTPVRTVLSLTPVRTAEPT